MTETALKLESTLEYLQNFFTSSSFEKEVTEAKNSFFENSAFFLEVNHVFEQRMLQFLDWYLLERPLKESNLTPVAFFEKLILEGKLENSIVDLKIVQSLKHVNHSLFKFIKVKNTDVYLKDLYTGKKVLVKSSQWTEGFEKYELIQTRLVPIDGSFYFCKGICIHPVNAYKFLKKQIKLSAKGKGLEKNDLLYKTIKLRYKFEQYKHVKVEMVYSEENLKKF